MTSTCPILPVLGVCILLGGCLRPIGFAHGDDTAGAATDDGTTTTSSAATTTLVTSSTSSAASTGASSPTTTTTSATGASSSSTSPAPVCGDGVVDPGEECDDGDDDDDDGCTSQCGRDRRIFVTSTFHGGDQIGGLEGGDSLCQKAAQLGGLPRPLAFKAWLSDQSTDARDRLFAGKGRYLRLDGLVVARSWLDLLDGALENPIVITETGESYESGVWTGTRPDGTRAVGADHCQDWTFADGFDDWNGGFYGFAGEFDGLWTFVPDEKINPGPCGGELALYCVEQ